MQQIWPTVFNIKSITQNDKDVEYDAKNVTLVREKAAAAEAAAQWSAGGGGGEGVNIADISLEYVNASNTQIKMKSM